jgi:hypothetical protein
MKRFLGFTLMLMVGCATGAAVRDLVAPARAQGQAGPSYQYEVVDSSSSSEEDKQILSKYGREGWRLVAVTMKASERRFLYFERPLPAH